VGFPLSLMVLEINSTEKPNSKLSYFSSMYTCINMYMYKNNANFQKR
jgi:hypothetical protein